MSSSQHFLQSTGQEPVCPTHEQIRDQVRRVLSSALFQRSDVLSRLLQFVIDWTLDGRGPLKEYTIGATFFGRGEDFDSRSDTIVRVQVRNLRAKLDDYYREAGVTDPVRIEIPKGAYEPVFSLTTPDQLIAPTVPEPEFQVEPPERKRLAGRYLAAAAIVVALGALGAALLWRQHRRSAAANRASIRTIAVLPFANRTSSPDNDYFADGLTEEIINALGRVPEFRVVARASVFWYRGNNVDIRKAGSELNAEAVMVGTVRQRGHGYRITAELTEVGTGYQLWSATYDAAKGDVVALQENIANAVAGRLKHAVGPLAATASATRSTDPEAYDLYLRARYFWNKTNFAGFKQAETYLRSSIERDPNFAQAYALLAMVYNGYGVWGYEPPRQTWPRAYTTALKALSIDEATAEAHTTMAGYKAYYEWDYMGADWEYQRALELAPNDAVCHQYYASFLGSLGRWDKAEREMRTARELDPASLLASWGEAQLRYWKRDFGGALDLLDQQLKLEPSFMPARLLRESVLVAQHRCAEAAASLTPARDRFGLIMRGVDAVCFAESGDLSKARSLLSELRAEQNTVPPLALTLAYLGSGDRTDAVRALQRGLEAREIRPGFLKVDPIYDSLQAQPDFQALLRECRLAQ